jgi:hypothetical protein
MEGFVQVIWTGQNNIGIVGLAITLTLEEAEQLPISKAMLIAPLVMHEKTVAHLGNQLVSARGPAALVSKRPELFLNFKQRYENSLPLSINAIQFLQEMGWVALEDGILRLRRQIPTDSVLGKRGERIAKSITNVAALLNFPAEDLYLNLRIEL